MTDSNTTGTGISQETQVETVAPTVVTTPVVPEVKTQETIVTTEAPKGWIADDWREKIAGADAKELARLQRFPDVNSVYKSFRELESKLSSGTVKLDLPDNPTEEQIAQYRKDRGIPATAADYELSLQDGLTIGENDEPIVSHMLEAMHAENLPPKVVNQIVNEFFRAREEMAASQQEEQKVIKTTNEEILRKEWGGNFLPNVMAVKNLLAAAPGGLGEALMVARLPDGSLLGNNAEAVKWLATVALDLNPAGTVVPGATGNQLQAIEDELKGLNDKMSKDIRAWHKDTASKARHRELLDAQGKLKARGY